MINSHPDSRSWLRWLGPLAATALFFAVGLVLHRELAHFHLRDIVAELRAIPREHDVLGLRYIQRSVAYSRSLFTSFIAYAFGHNLSLGALTGAAIRFRLYGSSGLTGTDVATLSGFCSLTSGIGLASLSAISPLI